MAWLPDGVETSVHAYVSTSSRMPHAGSASPSDTLAESATGSPADGAPGVAVSARIVGASVIRLPFNLGIGGAVQTGFRYAWEHGYELAVRCASSTRSASLRSSTGSMPSAAFDL